MKKRKNNTGESCPVYFYNFHDRLIFDRSFNVSEVDLLHKKLKKLVGLKNGYRAGLLTKDGQHIQWNEDIDREERPSCRSCVGASCQKKVIINEKYLSEFSNFEVERFDINYFSFFNVIFFNPTLNKLFGYDENRGGTLTISFYPSNLLKSKEKVEEKYILDVCASKKKYIDHTKKYLEDIL